MLIKILNKDYKIKAPSIGLLEKFLKIDLSKLSINDLSFLKEFASDLFNYNNIDVNVEKLSINKLVKIIIEAMNCTDEFDDEVDEDVEKKSLQ